MDRPTCRRANSDVTHTDTHTHRHTHTHTHRAKQIDKQKETTITTLTPSKKPKQNKQQHQNKSDITRYLDHDDVKYKVTHCLFVCSFSYQTTVYGVEHLLCLLRLRDSIFRLCLFITVCLLIVTQTSWYNLLLFGRRTHWHSNEWFRWMCLSVLAASPSIRTASTEPKL